MNDPTATKYKILKVDTSEVLSKDGKQRVPPLYHVALYVSSFVDFLFNCHELHQESLHCHQLEEELDDWCHRGYFQNGTGLSCCSPDSWCRRFNVVNASLKSERSLTRSVFSRIIERDPPILSVSKVLCLRHMIGEIFLRVLGPSGYRLLQFDHVRVEIHEIWDSFKKRSWSPFKIPLGASLFSNYGQYDGLFVL